MKLRAAALVLLMAVPPAAQAQDVRARSAKAVSTFDTIRNLATQVMPGLIPPKGCTRQDFDRAHEAGVAPDVTGCAPAQVVDLIGGLLGMAPYLTQTGPEAMRTPIVGQDPLPGRRTTPGARFTLILPGPAAATTPATPAPNDPAPAGPAPTAPEPTAQVPTAPDPTAPEKPPLAETTRPSQQAGANPAADLPVDPVQAAGAIVPPPPPSLGQQIVERFRGGLNPLWAAAALLAATFGASRLLRPRRVLLAGAPTVRCEMSLARSGQAQWKDARHIVLAAPLFEVRIIPEATLAGPLTVLSERLAP